MKWHFEPRRKPVVGVIAEGIDPAFVPNQLQGKNFVEPGQPPFLISQVHGTNCAYLLSEIIYHQVDFRSYRAVDNFIGDVDDVISAINQGVADDVDFFIQMYIISSGWVGFGNQTKMDELRTAMQNSGKLFISVSGNVPGVNLDNNIWYPPQFIHEGLTNMVTVSGTDQNDVIFTNWGLTTVNIAAPGKDIEMVTGGTDSGSSYSVPQVGALAALFLQINSSMTPQQLKDEILLHFENHGLNVITQGILNSFYPVGQSPPGSPPPILGGTAWQFDRNLDQRVVYPKVADGWPEMTIAAWIRLEGITGTHDIVSQWNYANGERTFLLARVNSNGKWHFEVGNDFVQGPTPIVGQDQLLVGRFGNGEISLTVDGQKFSTSATGTMQSQPTPLIVGDQGDFGNNNLQGVIGGVGIWDKILTDPELDTLFLDRDNLQTVRVADRKFLDMFKQQPTGTIINGPLTQIAIF